MTTRLLMCPPAGSRATVESLYPWGSPAPPAGGRSVTGDDPDLERDALRQWDRCVELLCAAGDVSIAFLEPRPRLPRLVFASSSALISGKLAFMGSPPGGEQRAEPSVYRAWLAANGFATTFLAKTWFAGAADALFDRRRPLLYVGYGWRSDRSAALQLGEALDVRVVPLLLADERFDRLDRTLCPLATGHVMAYMDAFTPHAQASLRRLIEPDALIELRLEDALAGAASAIEVGGDVLVVHDASRALRARLRSIGYRIFATDLSAFVRAAGGARSLALRLDDGPAAGAAAA